jgi:hypothetical protein
VVVVVAVVLTQQTEQVVLVVVVLVRLMEQSTREAVAVVQHSYQTETPTVDQVLSLLRTQQRLIR